MYSYTLGAINLGLRGLSKASWLCSEKPLTEGHDSACTAVTLTFDFFTPKPNQHIYEPNYICDQNRAKLPSLVSEICCSQGFRDAQTHSRTETTGNRSNDKAWLTPFGSTRPAGNESRPMYCSWRACMGRRLCQQMSVTVTDQCNLSFAKFPCTAAKSVTIPPRVCAFRCVANR